MSAFLLTYYFSKRFVTLRLHFGFKNMLYKYSGHSVGLLNFCLRRDLFTDNFNRNLGFSRKSISAYDNHMASTYRCCINYTWTTGCYNRNSFVHSALRRLEQVTLNNEVYKKKKKETEARVIALNRANISIFLFFFLGLQTRTLGWADRRRENQVRIAPLVRQTCVYRTLCVNPSLCQYYMPYTVP